MKKSKYLDPDLLSTLQNLSIKAKYVVEGFMLGLHKSPYHGFSVEFSEHRPYGFGDEVRHIDWKLWSKTDKYYIKQFEEETNLKAHIILDQSNSMDYGQSNNTKFEYAKLLAASFAYILIKQQDAVGLALFDEKINKILKKKLLNLEEENKSLKIANNLLGSKDDKSFTKIKINNLIKEVDQCIQHLSEIE